MKSENADETSSDGGGLIQSEKSDPVRRPARHNADASIRRVVPSDDAIFKTGIVDEIIDSRLGRAREDKEKSYED